MSLELKQEIKLQVCEAMMIKYQAKLRAKFDLWKKYTKIDRLTESKKKIRKHKIHVLSMLIESWAFQNLKKPFEKWKNQAKGFNKLKSS